MVEEEAWNAYPYTKTRYTCPFVEKFSLEIETYYFSDNGNQENVFKLTGSELRNRIIGIICFMLVIFYNCSLKITDVIDFVNDQLYGVDYLKEEDPKFYHSKKSGRGPLNENWLNEYWNEVRTHI